MSANNIIVRVTDARDLKYLSRITNEIDQLSHTQGINLLKRSACLIGQKIAEGEAIIACTAKGEWVGFSYIQSWDNGTYVANCSLVVAQGFRHRGVAGRIKERILALSLEKHPGAKVFGLTSSLAVMKVNTQLGYKPVTYSEITQQEAYWSACRSCPNYSILEGRKRKNCLCTAMLYTS